MARGCRAVWERGCSVEAGAGVLPEGSPRTTGRGAPAAVPYTRDWALRGGEEGSPRGHLGRAGGRSLSPDRAARLALMGRAGGVRASRRLRKRAEAEQVTEGLSSRLFRSWCRWARGSRAGCCASAGSQRVLGRRVITRILNCWRVRRRGRCRTEAGRAGRSCRRTVRAGWRGRQLD